MKHPWCSRTHQFRIERLPVSWFSPAAWIGSSHQPRCMCAPQKRTTTTTIQAWTQYSVNNTQWYLTKGTSAWLWLQIWFVFSQFLRWFLNVEYAGHSCISGGIVFWMLLPFTHNTDCSGGASSLHVVIMIYSLSRHWQHVFFFYSQTLFLFFAFKFCNFTHQIQPGLEVPQRGAGLDNKGTWHGANAENQYLREGDLLLFWLS